MGRARPEWDGVMLSPESSPSGSESLVQQVLSLTSIRSEPEPAVQDILNQLQAVPAAELSSRFGWHLAPLTAHPAAARARLRQAGALTPPT